MVLYRKKTGKWKPDFKALTPFLGIVDYEDANRYWAAKRRTIKYLDFEDAEMEDYE